MKGPNGAGITSGYDWTTDPQMMARYRPDQGLNDMVKYKSAWGALTYVGGAMPLGTDADGNPVWLKTKNDGKLLMTAGSTFYNGPNTLIHITQNRAGAPNNGDGIISSANFAAALTVYQNTTSIGQVGGLVFNVPATTANQNLYIEYLHSTESRYSVNGANWSTKQNSGGNDSYSGLAFGGRANPPAANFEFGGSLAELIVLEGKPSQAWLNGFIRYARARYPSMGIAAPGTMLPFSVDQTSRGALPGGAFDVIPMLGQSNEGCNANTATVAPGANTYMLGNNNVVQALTLLYDLATDQLDTISTDGSMQAGGLTSLPNTYAAASGRPLLVIPCMRASSGFPGGNIVLGCDWSPQYPRGNRLRNSLFGSAVARTKNALALGGTWRFGHITLGESAAQGDATSSGAFAAQLDAMLTEFCAAVGVPNRWVIQNIADIDTGANPGNTAIVQAGIAALATPGKYIIAPPWPGPMSDGVHMTAAGFNTVGAAGANLAVAQGAPWV